MKIVIALPAYFNIPIGGFHVHYQYANLLSRLGHDVSIVFPRHLQGIDSLRTRVGTGLWALRLHLANRPLIGSFPVDPRVKIRLLRHLGGVALPDADVLIATAWQTAEVLAGAPSRCGRKFYIAYDYEHWMTAIQEVQDRISRTYRLDFRVVATSAVVAETIRVCGGTPVAQIACGIDFDAFGIDTPSADRGTLSVGFPVRTESFKGIADALAAMALLRDRYGDRLTVSAFGSRPVALPDWVQWKQYPSQAELRAFYNAQSVFLLPSHFEGWGLTGVEAMACGTALVTTDNGGSRDYATDGVTALVVPPHQPQQIADAIARLFDDEPLRLRLSMAGHEFVQRFTWKRAIDQLEVVLTKG